MKALVLSVAFGALSLTTCALSARSRDMVAEQLPQSSSSPNDQQSPPSTGPGQLLQQTFHDKFMDFAVMTVGPRALFTPAIPAAIGMANPPNRYPAAWRQGAEAFGRNYGDQLATASAFETARFAAGAALHEDLRYHPSASTNFFKRTGHALAYTFVDRSDDGHARLAAEFAPDTRYR